MVELVRGGLAAAAVFLVHLGVALADADGDAGAHGALAVAAVGESLGAVAVGDEVAGDVLDGRAGCVGSYPL